MRNQALRVIKDARIRYGKDANRDRRTEKDNELQASKSEKATLEPFLNYLLNFFHKPILIDYWQVKPLAINFFSIRAMTFLQYASETAEFAAMSVLPNFV